VKRIYVCSPFAAPTAAGVLENVERARAICRDVAKRGDAPLAVHLLYPGFLDDTVPEERALGIACGLAWLAAADEVRVFGSPTAGMQFEIDAAHVRGIPIVPPFKEIF
jgi:hypothetical protein